MRELAIVGAGGHGIVVAEAARLQGLWDLIELYDDAPQPTADLAGFALAGRVTDLRERLVAPPAQGLEVVIAIGRNAVRRQLAQAFLEMGASLATVIHPAAVLSPSCTIGAGCVVLARAVVGARARLGQSCIVNVGAIVDHDCILGHAVHVAPGAVLVGAVRVGDGSWIATGACLMPGVAIPPAAEVAGGSAVMAAAYTGTRVERL